MTTKFKRTFLQMKLDECFWRKYSSLETRFGETGPNVRPFSLTRTIAKYDGTAYPFLCPQLKFIPASPPYPCMAAEWTARGRCLISHTYTSYQDP